jgi:hypothetical protein
VAEALGRPEDFFRWLSTERQSDKSTQIIAAARAYLRVATWEWDRACILAGALCASQRVASATAPTDRLVEERFPYWVALDKHTDQGKAALREVARDLKVGYRQLIWTSFYCESARVNTLLFSPWFEAERAWRFARAKFSYERAQELWFRARERVRNRLEKDEVELKRLVELGPTTLST